MTDQYCVPPNYTHRAAPGYFDDVDTGRTEYVFQPDIYRRADQLARLLTAPTIIDVGAGSGDKLAQLHGSGRHVIALDFGDNLERGPRRQSHIPIAWREYDAEQQDTLPVADDEMRGAVVICADVIEHVIHPERLLRALRGALDGGAAVAILSTPDRERMWGAEHTGPPPNPHHVREWARDELVALVKREGMACGFAGWTREHDMTASLRTIELVIPRDDTVMAQLDTLANRYGDVPAGYRPLKPMRPGVARYALKAWLELRKLYGRWLP